MKTGEKWENKRLKYYCKSQVCIVSSYIRLFSWVSILPLWLAQSVAGAWLWGRLKELWAVYRYHLTQSQPGGCHSRIPCQLWSGQHITASRPWEWNQDGLLSLLVQGRQAVRYNCAPTYVKLVCTCHIIMSRCVYKSSRSNITVHKQTVKAYTNPLVYRKG